MPYPDSEYPSVLRGYDKRQSQRLLAAAPAMLDRLKSLVGGAECECDKADDQHPLCDICWSHQVIAKAEGRPDA
jgi:hypothetical protein